MKKQEQILHTPEGVRDIYGNEFVQKFELQQQLYRLLAEEKRYDDHFYLS